jgi:hypothetical protein
MLRRSIWNCSQTVTQCLVNDLYWRDREAVFLIIHREPG